VAFRGDAAFAKPEMDQALEDGGVKYTIRIQAASPTTTRRVVAKVEFHAGELFPRGLHRH